MSATRKYTKRTAATYANPKALIPFKIEQTTVEDQDCKFHCWACSNTFSIVKKKQSRLCPDCNGGTRFNHVGAWPPSKFILSLWDGLVSASSRGKRMPVSISYQDLLALYVDQAGKCAITGVPMTTLRGQGTVFTNVSIDRIDSCVGYHQGNVHLVCGWVNIAKSTLSVGNFQEWCSLVTEMAKST